MTQVPSTPAYTVTIDSSGQEVILTVTRTKDNATAEYIITDADFGGPTDARQPS